VIRLVVPTLVGLLLAPPAGAQQPDSSLLTVQRIYGSAEFRSQTFGPARWLGDGSAYTTLEEADSEGGQNLVRYDSERGARQVLLVARQSFPRGTVFR
jgi:dipeptidyl-peptidase 4